MCCNANAVVVQNNFVSERLHKRIPDSRIIGKADDFVALVAVATEEGEYYYCERRAQTNRLPEPFSYIASSTAKVPQELRDYLSKLGKKGGKKGGPARAAAMTPEQRSESARKAARWAKKKKASAE